MRRVLAAALLVVLGACSNGTEVRLTERSKLPSELYGDPRAPRADLHNVSVVLYFVRTDENGMLIRPIKLGAFPRQVSTDLRTVDLAMRLLLAGPTAQESSAGFRTAIQEGTELIGVSTERGVADINVSAEFEAVTSQEGHLMKIAQVVWTLTELSDIDAVRFRIHGVAQPVIDQNGVAHELVGRGRYSRFAPLEPTDSGPVGGSVGPEGTSSP